MEAHSPYSTFCAVLAMRLAEARDACLGHSPLCSLEKEEGAEWKSGEESGRLECHRRWSTFLKRNGESFWNLLVCENVKDRDL